MKSELKLTLIIIEKVVNIMTYFLDKKRRKERENETQKIQEDPVDWFNDRYSKRVSDDGTDESTSDPDSDETKR